MNERKTEKEEGKKERGKEGRGKKGGRVERVRGGGEGVREREYEGVREWRREEVKEKGRVGEEKGKGQ